MVETRAKGYDLLIVSSKKIAQELQKRGVQAIYIPEFTNSEKFYFEPREELVQDIIFVGNFHFFREGPIYTL
jgi:uroporphyrinogen-III synthase